MRVIVWWIKRLWDRRMIIDLVARRLDYSNERERQDRLQQRLDQVEHEYVRLLMEREEHSK